MEITNTVFKIGNNDYSGHVIAGTYNVNEYDEYTLWEDANKREHRDVIRTRIEGSFDMFFNSAEDFQTFYQTYKAAADASGLTPITVMNNTTNTLVSINAYIDFELVRNRHDNWQDYYEVFSVNVKEW